MEFITSTIRSILMKNVMNLCDSDEEKKCFQNIQRLMMADSDSWERLFPDVIFRKKSRSIVRTTNCPTSSTFVEWLTTNHNDCSIHRREQHNWKKHGKTL